MKIATPNTAPLRRTAVNTSGSEYALWAGSHAEPQASAQSPSPHFTPRQLEVLALLCEGLPNKLICRRLDIATGTVKVHISCILRELGVASRLQAVVAAGRCGLAGDHVAATPDE